METVHRMDYECVERRLAEVICCQVLYGPNRNQPPEFLRFQYKIRMIRKLKVDGMNRSQDSTVIIQNR